MKARGALLLFLTATSCTQPVTERAEPVPPELSPFVLERLPEQLTGSLAANFEGKVQLVGYQLDSPALAAPGDAVALTLYWRSSSKLDPEWSLFTHLVQGRRQVQNVDDQGPLRIVSGGRQALGPGRWRPGAIYADKLAFTLPPACGAKSPADGRCLEDGAVAIMVGIWRGNARLRVLSGAADSEHRARVLSLKLKTGR